MSLHMNSIRFEFGKEFFFVHIGSKRTIHSPKTTTVLIQYTQADGTRGKIAANVVN